MIFHTSHGKLIWIILKMGIFIRLLQNMLTRNAFLMIWAWVFWQMRGMVLIVVYLPMDKLEVAKVIRWLDMGKFSSHTTIETSGKIRGWSNSSHLRTEQVIFSHDLNTIITWHCCHRVIYFENKFSICCGQIEDHKHLVKITIWKLKLGQHVMIWRHVTFYRHFYL